MSQYPVLKEGKTVGGKGYAVPKNVLRQLDRDIEADYRACYPSDLLAEKIGVLNAIKLCRKQGQN